MDDEVPGSLAMRRKQPRQPERASSSGWMCVSVMNTKENRSVDDALVIARVV
ncbi:hypothetical protein [Xanthomonas arboricola]|uniref:hypothetical protein n=1 Tax=Xanthomonas arboricola TaxID=56448 RepID=UPI001EE7410F|nr:hypothetical protein [Xanthomonas arboricola]